MGVVEGALSCLCRTLLHACVYIRIHVNTHRVAHPRVPAKYARARMCSRVVCVCPCVCLWYARVCIHRSALISVWTCLTPRSLPSFAYTLIALGLTGRHYHSSIRYAQAVCGGSLYRASVEDASVYRVRVCVNVCLFAECQGSGHVGVWNL